MHTKKKVHNSDSLMENAPEWKETTATESEADVCRVVYYKRKGQFSYILSLDQSRKRA